MAAIDQQKLIKYIKKLEVTIKKYQKVIQERDADIQKLQTQVSFLQTSLKSNHNTAPPAPVVEPVEQVSDEPKPSESVEEQPQEKRVAFSPPKKIIPREGEDKPKTFIKKVELGTQERLQAMANQSEEPVDDRPRVEEEKLPVAESHPEPDEQEPEAVEEEAAEATADEPEEEVKAPLINFEAGEFLEKVLDGEEQADEVKAQLQRLASCEKDERRNVLMSLTRLHWDLVTAMGKRIGKENLCWEKRLLMRFGMLDENLMGERRDIWDQLYLDKSKPGDSGVYYVDELMEAVYKGEMPFSAIDEMALDGAKPDFKATGDKALGYEIINVPQMQRMAVGARANLVSIMVQEYCQPGRDTPAITRKWLQEVMPGIKKADLKMLYRKRKGEEYEIEPIFLLFPGYGQLAGCWEPWSAGRKKDTGPRICMCVFPPRSSLKALLMGIADYRWEYAKADAMHYWLSEGLTGNWLQMFNKKEQRKDLKQVFIDNYFLWVKFEANRIPKMEKKFREFFWHNMPLHNDIKQELKTSGLFRKLVELEEAKKKREEEEKQEIERIKAEREARKAARQAKSGG